MGIITTIFWDVGGVLLSNAWEKEARRETAARFGLDETRFEGLHLKWQEPLEKGEISLDEYLQHTVFHQPRAFSAAEFKERMRSFSKPKEENLAFLGHLALSSRLLLAALNNESAELNQFRIETFGLTRLLNLFLSSCYLGLRKPDPRIYQRAMAITQVRTDSCVFIDDRPENTEGARRAGMPAILYETPTQLRHELKRLGVNPQYAAR